MGDKGGNKVTGIRQIVNLKRFLQRWQNVTLGHKDNISPRSGEVHHSISPAVSRRLMTSNAYAESDDDTCHSPDTPVDVPRGYLAVYVVPEIRRFIIPTSYLSEPVFKELLRKSEEEFGYDHSGGLALPCEIETFKYILQSIESKRRYQGAVSL